MSGASEASDEAVETLVRVARAREALGEATEASAFVRDATVEHPELYRNQHERLNIDFSVSRLDFPHLQTMDPRIVRIRPGHNNELHKHAHESLFVVIAGQGEVRVGETWQPIGVGDVAFVPRWIFHQTRNPSPDTELVMIAITDYGFTSAALGEYDKRTRLSAGGDQAWESEVPEAEVEIVLDEPEAPAADEAAPPEIPEAPDDAPADEPALARENASEAEDSDPLDEAEPPRRGFWSRLFGSP